MAARRGTGLFGDLCSCLQSILYVCEITISRVWLSCQLLFVFLFHLFQLQLS